VRTVAFAPDGVLIASGGSDNKVLVWEAQTGKRLRQFPLEDRVNTVAFSADGQLLAAGSSYVQGADPGRAWSVATGVEQFRFGGIHRTVNAVAFSPDGKTLASGNDGDSIELLEVATGRGIRTLHQYGYVQCVAFSPDGRTLASAATAGNDNGPRLWDLATGQVLRQITGVTEATLAVVFTPDNRTLLSAGRDSAALLWPVGQARKPSFPSPSAADLEALWEKLTDDNPAPAHRALWQLVDRPDLSVPFLRGKLRPAKAVPWSPEWIAKLDSSSFQDREDAMARLERLPDALPEMQKASARPASVEAGRRLDLIVRKLTTRLTPDWLRTLRSIQVLELIGDREAWTVLEGLAGGAAAARLTHETRAALKRLDVRAAAAGKPPFRP
jgi:WD40 repeat protein